MAPEVSGDIVKLLNIDISKDKFALAKALGHDMLYVNIGCVTALIPFIKKIEKLEKIYIRIYGE
ncbi:MAG: hypothetical protein U5N58_01675 [Actinomycetota bacterium]|nr:hypothetical protein [Actinomycetota bacterium]